MSADEIVASIARRAAEVSGTLGVWARSLATGETVEWNEVVRQTGEGRILKDLTPGLDLPIRDLAVLMIVVSDNTAANLLIDLVGTDAVNESMWSLGLQETVLEHSRGAGINLSPGSA